MPCRGVARCGRYVTTCWIKRRFTGRVSHEKSGHYRSLFDQELLGRIYTVGTRKRFFFPSEE